MTWTGVAISGGVMSWAILSEISWGVNGLINASHYVFRMQLPGTLQFFAMFIVLLEAIFLAAFLHQFDSGAEGDEIPHFAHVDAIAIGVSDLGGGGDDDDLFGFEPGQHPDDTFLRVVPADDGVVNDDEGIDPFRTVP